MRDREHPLLQRLTATVVSDVNATLVLSGCFPQQRCAAERSSVATGWSCGDAEARTPIAQLARTTSKLRMRTIRVLSFAMNSILNWNDLLSAWGVPRCAVLATCLISAVDSIGRGNTI